MAASRRGETAGDAVVQLTYLSAQPRRKKSQATQIILDQTA